MYTIDIYSPKGGVGKSTLTASMGSCLAQQGYNVVLVDTDEQRSLMDMFKGDQIGVDIVTTMPASDSQYDVCIVDHHPSHKKLPQGDLVIMPMRPNTIDIRAVRRSARNVAGKKILLVVTQVDQRQENQKLHWLDMRNNYDALKVNNRSIYQRANDDHKTVFQMGAKYGANDARKEIMSLVETSKQIIF